MSVLCVLQVQPGAAGDPGQHGPGVGHHRAAGRHAGPLHHEPLHRPQIHGHTGLHWIQVCRVCRSCHFYVFSELVLMTLIWMCRRNVNITHFSIENLLFLKHIQPCYRIIKQIIILLLCKR